MIYITVPRCLLFKAGENSVLHTFVDASKDDNRAVTYVRHENKEKKRNVTVKFVCSKTRVIQLTVSSVPILELNAAVLGLRLAIIAITVGCTLKLNQHQMDFGQIV